MANVVSTCFYPVLLVISWTPRSSLPRNLAFHTLELLISLCFLYLCFVLICYPSIMCSVHCSGTCCYVYSLPLCYFTQSALPNYQTGCCSVLHLLLSSAKGITRAVVCLHSCDAP